MLRNRKCKYIFCDLDGTLLDDRMRHYQCYKSIVEKYGGSCISIDEYWEDKRSMVNRKKLLEKSMFMGSYEDYASEWLRRIEEETYLRHEVLKEHVIEGLVFLKERTSKLVLATMRRDQNALLRQLNGMEIISFFDGILVGDPLKMKKCDLVTNYYGDSAIVIGDTEADGELARKIGSKFFAVTTGLRRRGVLDADYYIEGIHELIEPLQKFL